MSSTEPAAVEQSAAPQLHPLRVFVSTSRSQGHRANDFNWLPEGELVIPGYMCDTDQGDPDGGCGCARSWSGMTALTGTTTAVVAELELTPEQYEELVLEFYRKCGVLKDGDPDAPKLIESIRDEAHGLLELASDWPVDTIVERRGHDVEARELSAEQDTETAATG